LTGDFNDDAGSSGAGSAGPTRALPLSDETLLLFLLPIGCVDTSKRMNQQRMQATSWAALFTEEEEGASSAIPPEVTPSSPSVYNGHPLEAKGFQRETDEMMRTGLIDFWPYVLRKPPNKNQRLWNQPPEEERDQGHQLGPSDSTYSTGKVDTEDWAYAMIASVIRTLDCCMYHWPIHGPCQFLWTSAGDGDVVFMKRDIVPTKDELKLKQLEEQLEQVKQELVMLSNNGRSCV